MVQYYSLQVMKNKQIEILNFKLDLVDFKKKIYYNKCSVELSNQLVLKSFYKES